MTSGFKSAGAKSVRLGNGGAPQTWIPAVHSSSPIFSGLLTRLATHEL
jgi:hypothetical protein